MADAVTVTDWVPSTVDSLTPVISKVTESLPSGMVTLAGTVASVVSLLVKLTVRSPTVPELRDTVAVETPPFSSIEGDPIVTDKLESEVTMR